MNKTLIRITALAGAIAIGTCGVYAAGSTKDAADSTSTEVRADISKEDGGFRGGKRLGGKFSAGGPVYTYTIDAESGKILDQSSKELEAAGDSEDAVTGATKSRSGKSDKSGSTDAASTEDAASTGKRPSTDSTAKDDNQKDTEEATDKKDDAANTDTSDEKEAAPEPEAEDAKEDAVSDDSATSEPSDSKPQAAADADAEQDTAKGRSAKRTTGSDDADRLQTDEKTETRTGRGGKSRSDADATDSSAKISRSEAEEIALKEAGVSTDEAHVRVRLQKTDDGTVYKVTVFVPAEDA